MLYVFHVVLWSPAGKGLTFWHFACDVFLCFCPFHIWCPGQVCYLIVSIPDLCSLPYLELNSELS